MNRTVMHGRTRPAMTGVNLLQTSLVTCPDVSLPPRRAIKSNLTELRDQRKTGGSAMQRRIRELKNNQSGFTLIELLIVIVILGVLAAIVVFAVSAFNKNGQQAACKADFKNVEIADEAYFAKNQAYATGLAPVAGLAARTDVLEGSADATRTTRSRSRRPARTSTVGTVTSTDSSACSGLTLSQTPRMPVGGHAVMASHRAAVACPRMC